jgi:hypothetical protein
MQNTQIESKSVPLRRLSARLLIENFNATGQILILEGTAQAHVDNSTGATVPSGMRPVPQLTN